MNKFELIDRIAQVTKFTKKEVNLTITIMLEIIVNTVAKNEKVTLVGFGSFKSRQIRKNCEYIPGYTVSTLNTGVKKPVFLAGKFFKNKVSLLN